MASSHDRMHWRREGVETGGVWEQMDTTSAVGCTPGRSSQHGGTGTVALRVEDTHLGHGEDLGMETLSIFITVVLTWSCASPQIAKLSVGVNCDRKAIPQETGF